MFDVLIEMVSNWISNTLKLESIELILKVLILRFSFGLILIVWTLIFSKSNQYFSKFIETNQEKTLNMLKST